MCIIWFVWFVSAVALHNSINASTLRGGGGGGVGVVGKCPAKILPSYLNTLTNVEHLQFGVQVNANLERGQQKRYSFQIHESTPVLINLSTFPQGILTRQLYFNQTTDLSPHVKMDSKEIFLPCAINGKYDLILISERKSSIRIEIIDRHPSANWPLLNRSIPIKVRFQNRIHKKQMIIKWSKSKLDIHAVRYCLVINTKSPKQDFCQAINESVNNTINKMNCMITSPMENVWYKHVEKIKNIDPYSTNIVCTGLKTTQMFRGFIPNKKYYIDIFGVHTKLRNLTFLLRSKVIWFNRTHPNRLFDNILTTEKISTMTNVAVFSYKVPSRITAPIDKLRFLVLPCGGSQIDMKILKQKQIVKYEKDIYRPIYITLNNIKSGERFISRISPSNEDEIFKANRISIAATVYNIFPRLPELPMNTTIFEIRSYRNCKSTTIAWYSSPETRKFRYCVIVFTTPNSNRSSIDQTNYCMDFGKRITKHPQFHNIRCLNQSKEKDKIERFQLLNLTPGDSYLVYVTISLVGGKSIPYETLKINIKKHCHNEFDDIEYKNNSFYDN